MNNIVLINLPLAPVSRTAFYTIPVGLMSIASYLIGKGETVSLIDLNILLKSDESSLLADIISRCINEIKPVFVGISVMIAGQFKLAVDICALVKATSDAITVVGGAHVSQFSKTIIENCTEIDFVVIGEGEQQAYACAQFAKTRTLPESWPARLEHRYQPKLQRSLNQKLPYVDVNEIPMPNYDLVNFHDYRHDTSTWHNPYNVDLSLRVPIITSRGCPNLCNFCSVAKCMGIAYRPIHAESVVDILQMLYEKKGASYFAIFDANFAQEPPRVIEICNQIIKKNLKITLDLPTGLPLNATVPDMIDSLADAGLIRTCISVETGDEFIRNEIMLKNVIESEVMLVVEAIRRHPQIFLLTDFIIGMPEDTEESLEKSFELISKLDTDDIELSIATPYPGTKLYDQSITDKLFIEGVDFDSLYISDWYTHSNLNKFIIKPYNMELERLSFYRDKILGLRANKQAAYKQRMIKYFIK